MLIGPWVSTSIYDIPTIDFVYTAVLTNTAPTAPYRGAGRPEAIYIIERLFDAAARKIGLDPVGYPAPQHDPAGADAVHQRHGAGLRQRQFPFRSSTRAWRWRIGTISPCAKAESKARGLLRGRGIASFLEWTGANVFEERVTVAVKGDGEIEVYASTMPMGQGIATSYAQLVVDVFGVPIETRSASSWATPIAASASAVPGSRSLFTAGSAIEVASQTAVKNGRDLAAEALEVAAADIEYVEGVFQVAGTDRRIGLFELAEQQPEQRIYVDSTSKVSGPSWPNGCHVCEVEVDPQTGIVEIVSYTSVNDVGRVVNPMIVRGQLDGGAVQGIGQALGEHMLYDQRLRAGDERRASWTTSCRAPRSSATSCMCWISRSPARTIRSA